MNTILMVSETIIAALLVFVVLVQNAKASLNLSTMSGGMNAVTKRGPEKVLHNATIVLGALFVINSLVFFFIK